MKGISSKLTHFIAILCLCMVHLGCETEEEAETALEVGAESTEEEGGESTEDEGGESTEEEGGEITEEEGGEGSQCEDADCGAAAFQPTPCWDGYEPGVSCESNDAGNCEWVVEDCSENPCDLLACDESNETCEVVDGQAYCVKEDPCYNLECGDSCSTCPPGEDCIGGEYCNAEGQCFPGEPTCGEDLCADFIPPCSNNDECPGDMICSFEGCNPSQADCDPETGAIGGTDDCGGGVCVEATADLCADFIPPCSNNDECPGDMICSFEGCNPSSASCDPETGEVTITKDCGGGVCISAPGNPCDGLSCGDVCDTCPPDAPCPGVMEYCNAEGQCTSQEPLCEGDFCADFIPPCQNDEGCPNGMICSFEGCNPSNASCDPETGAIISTDDCGGGQCVMGCEPGSSVPAADGCNTCICPESGNPAEAISCTEMACEQGTCMSSEDCNDNEFCDFADDTCGVFGEMGTCAPQPEDCGSLFTQGFCGCDGSTTGNPCQMAATGQDIFKYGGCDNLSSGTSFLCGEIQCLNDSWCSIEFNEDPGAFEPDYFTSCIPLDDSQTQGDCTTFFPGALATCFDDGNFTIIFSTYE